VAPRTSAQPSGSPGNSTSSVGSLATQSAPARVSTQTDSKGEVRSSIRSVDMKEFLSAHYGEVNAEFADLETDCSEGQKPIQSLAPVRYGDLDGDGQEEAAFLAWSCLSGNGGADFFGVLRMTPDGKLVALPIQPPPKLFKGRNTYDGLRGHMNLQIEDGRLMESYPVYLDERACENCAKGGERHFIFRWDGHQFVLDDMIDVPPAKSGN
jgi:hypothetical protein